MSRHAIDQRLAASPPVVGRSFFEASHISNLPEPARRWLTHAISPGTPICDRTRLTMHGSVRLGRWRAYTATEELAPETGFLWSARTTMAGLPLSGYDAFSEGEGRQHWRLFGLIPVQSAEGMEVTRSAADRLAAECALLPTSLVRAQWRPGPNADSATYALRVGGRFARTKVTVHVAADGRLKAVTMMRWGTPPGAKFGQYPFRVRFDGEYRRQGIAVPTDLTAAWLLPEGSWFEFFRAHIDAAHFSWAQQ
jgi:uncharacterized protein DUF6544